MIWIHLMIAYLKNCICVKHLLWNKLALTQQCPNIVILLLRETELFFGWQNKVEEPKESWASCNHEIGSYCIWWDMRLEKKPNQKQMTSQSVPVKHRVFGFYSKDGSLLSKFFVTCFSLEIIRLTPIVMKKSKKLCFKYFFLTKMSICIPHFS